MESLIFALVIGLTVYLFVRRMRMLKEQKRRQPEAAGNGDEPAEAATMPRLGTPGTVTRDQLAQLKANDFEPSRLWSREEAKLILDCVTYLRAAIYMVTGETDPPIEVQNNLLRHILTHDELRDYIYEWGLNRTRDDETAPQPVLERDETFAKIESAILEQWESA